MTPRPRTTAVRKRRTIDVSDRAYAFMTDDPEFESHEGDPMETLDEKQLKDEYYHWYDRWYTWAGAGAVVLGVGYFVYSRR